MKKKVFYVLLALALVANLSLVIVPPTIHASSTSPTYITFSEAKSGYAGSTSTVVSSIEVTKPMGTTAGNLLVAEVTWDSDSGPGTVIPPPGWTTLNQAKYSYSSGNSAVTVGVYYKIAIAEDASVDSYEWSWSTAESVYTFILLIKGNDTSNPISTSGIAEGYSSTPTCPTIASTEAGALILRLYGSDRGNSNTDKGYPSGCTGISSDSSGKGTLSGECSGGAAFMSQSTNGNTGTAAFAITPTATNPTWRSFTITITPDAGTSSSNLSPDQPVLVAPMSGSSNISVTPTLNVTASDPDADTLSVAFYGRKATIASGEDFTIVVLPDTQNYSASYPEIFNSQTQWIVNNRSAWDIAYVAHEGDVVNTSSNATEWSRAVTAMSKLEDPNVTGLTDGIPYGMLPGNHDASSYFNTSFGVSRFTGRGYYGGHYGTTNDNNFGLFSAHGMDLIVINLQYSPTTAILDWADSLLKTYSERRGIVVTHYILNVDNSWGLQNIYTALKDNSNLFLMLCGHMHSSSDGEAQRIETGDNGNKIYILQADYQERANGGNGWLRILQFSTKNDQISVKTYSPYLNSYETDADSQFVLPYDMEESEDFTLIGTVSGVSSGSTASIIWPDLDSDTAYEWYAVVSDGSLTTTGLKWSFTTGTTSTYAVTATASPSAGGMISGAGTYSEGDAVNLTATAATGYSFSNWSGTYSGTNVALTFYMPANAVVETAAFTPNTYTLTATASPSTGGSIVGIGSYTYGAPVTLTAAAATGYTFSGWTGTYGSTNATLNFSMPANAVVETATFTQTANLALNKLATADSQQTSAGNTASKGNDGNSSTRWCANDSRPNHWWKVDLGRTYTLTGTKVVFQYARNYRYKIEVSTDNINWTVVVNKTANTSTAQTRQDSFSQTAGRYVRITYTVLPWYPSTRASHYEFEVRGN
jgi:uncharacterized repeat protein (TIGR02543 family)